MRGAVIFAASLNLPFIWYSFKVRRIAGLFILPVHNGGRLRASRRKSGQQRHYVGGGDLQIDSLARAVILRELL